jgi:hypothetical protein
VVAESFCVGENFFGEGIALTVWWDVHMKDAVMLADIVSSACWVGVACTGLQGKRT